MTFTLLERLRELERRATTPAPWRAFKWGDGSQKISGRSNVGYDEWEVVVAADVPDFDAELIAESRTALPKLIEALSIYHEALEWQVAQAYRLGDDEAEDRGREALAKVSALLSEGK